jgi:hypothetical protein
MTVPAELSMTCQTAYSVDRCRLTLAVDTG